MARVEKEYIVEEIREKLKETPNFYISNFINIKAEQFNELRNRLAQNSSYYFVVKNRLCRLALEKANMKKIADLIDGSTGFIFCHKNAIPISRILTDFSKEAEGFTIRGGFIEGEVLDEKQIRELASLPDRNEMMGMLAYAFKSPLIKFANIFRHLITGLVISLSQIQKRKEEEKEGMIK
ncbi:MAG TPA: 50S ribosomal protein L10 [Candidatus Omnitrophica bacterium]|nr:50S ribosomal protein L10 [Candidatus Omnitrophota bacterium]